MLRFLFIFLAALFFVTTGCSQDPFAGFTKTPKGSYLKNQTKVEGRKAQSGDMLSFHYTLGKKDSIIETSLKQGMPVEMELPAADKITHLFEGFSAMAAGDSLTLIIPADSVQNILRGRLKGEKWVYFGFRLLSIRAKAEIEAEKKAMAEYSKTVAEKVKQTVADYAGGKLTDQLKTTPEGVKYIIHEQGNGAKPVKGSNVKVHYYGVLTNGTKFDASFERGQPYAFQIGTPNTIQGWNVGVPLMNEGGKATIFVPYALAYGEHGRPPQIPGKAELIFYLELKEVK